MNLLHNLPKRIAAVLAASALLLGSIIIGPAAQASNEGTVTVKVSLPSGVDPKGLGVRLFETYYDSTEDYWDFWDVPGVTAEALNSTTFKYSGVPAGRYTVVIFGAGIATQFLGNVSEPDASSNFVLTSGQNKTISFAAQAASGVEATTVSVPVNLPSGLEEGEYDVILLQEFTYFECLEEDEFGDCVEFDTEPIVYWDWAEYFGFERAGNRFNFIGVTPGEKFRAVVYGQNFAETYSGNTSDFDQAAEVTAVSGATTSFGLISPVAFPTGTLVVPIYTDNTIDQIYVTLYQISSNGLIRSELEYGSLTQEGSAVTFRHVPVGSRYIIELTYGYNDTTGTFKYLYSGNKTSWSSAAHFSISANKKTTLPALKLGKATTPAFLNRNFELPKISGIAKIGHTLTASSGTWDSTSPAISYQWLANGSPIQGATSKTIKLTAAQADKKISVKVTATDPGFVAGTATSAATGQVARLPLSATKAPTIAGKAAVGSKLTATAGGWSTQGVSVSYQWLANGKAINGATRNTLAVTPDLVGKAIAVKVAGAKQGHTLATALSRNTGKVAKAVSTVSGKLSKASIKKSKSTTIKVKVSTPGNPRPTGTIRVKVGKKTVKTTLKASHNGTAKITLKGSKLAKGKKQKVSVSFTPSGSTAKAATKSGVKHVGKLTVK